MSKITFRADDDLVARIEAMDASKSEVMREALRAYFGSDSVGAPTGSGSLDTLITDRIDERIDERLGNGTDVNITVSVEDDGVRATDPEPTSDDSSTSAPAPGPAGEYDCAQCGETLDDDHVYCPNCGEKAEGPAACECGVELHTDWAFCPSCGRRTPAADVLDR